MRRFLMLLGAAACLALPACGSEEDDAPSASATTIENKLGTVEVPPDPKRVVALDAASADDAISPAPEQLQRFASSSLFQDLDAVRRGAYVELDLPTASSMAFPSLLSVPYSLREIVPALARAVQ